jgi:hypothetical protein
MKSGQYIVFASFLTTIDVKSIEMDDTALPEAISGDNAGFNMKRIAVGETSRVHRRRDYRGSNRPVPWIHDAGYQAVFDNNSTFTWSGPSGVGGCTRQARIARMGHAP